MLNLSETGRILYISSVDISIGNGPGVNEREFVTGLYQALGERAHFLIPRPQSPVADIPEQVCTFTAPHHLHSPRHFPAHLLSQMRKADQLLSRRQFDLLVFRLDILPLAPLYITRKHHLPYALKTLGQGLINVFNERIKIVGPLLAKWNTRLVAALVNQAIVADSVSTLQVEFLQKKLDLEPDKVIWIDNAVNTSRFFPVTRENARKKLGLADFDPIVGYVGSRPWERGAMAMVEAAPVLRKKYPELGLLILGDGKELELLKKRARELQVEKHCHFCGYVPFDRVPDYVNSLDVGVSISLRPDRSAASELKVRQYLACGRPVVISPGSNDFVEEEGFGSIVQPDDLQGITARLDRWLSLQGDEREQFTQRAAQYMHEHLSIAAAVAQRFKIWSERMVSRPSANGNHRNFSRSEEGDK